MELIQVLLTLHWRGYNIRALSLNQPYADFVVLGKKTIELRSWNTKFRGTFLVHASKKSMIDFVDDKYYKKFNLEGKTIITGAIIGKATLYDVRNYCSIVEKNPDLINMDLLREDEDKHLAMGYEEGRKKLYGFMLKNAIKFENPIPYKGQLNFFNVEDSIQTKLGLI